MTLLALLQAFRGEKWLAAMILAFNNDGSFTCFRFFSTASDDVRIIKHSFLFPSLYHQE